MARAYFEDPLQNFCFALIEASGLDQVDPQFKFVFRSRRARAISGASTFGVDRATLISQGKIPRDANNTAFIGCSAVTFPEMSHEEMVIEEGNWPFARKVPKGSISVSDMTVSRAMFPSDCDYYLWFMQAAWGIGGPRRDFLLVRLDRARQTVTRKHRLVGCWPKGLNPSDLNAEDGSVSIEELTLSVEQVQELPVDVSVGDPAPEPVDTMGSGLGSNVASFA